MKTQIASMSYIQLETNTYIVISVMWEIKYLLQEYKTATVGLRYFCIRHQVQSGDV